MKEYKCSQELLEDFDFIRNATLNVKKEKHDRAEYERLKKKYEN